MGRARGAASTKKKGLSCPDGACYLSSDTDTDSACSDSDCSDCYECPPKRSSKSKSKTKQSKLSSSKSSKSASGSQQQKKKKKKKKAKRDSSSSCSCSDCMGYSSDDSYNCPPARRGRGPARKCSTC